MYPQSLVHMQLLPSSYQFRVAPGSWSRTRSSLCEWVWLWGYLQKWYSLKRWFTFPFKNLYQNWGVRVFSHHWQQMTLTRTRPWGSASSRMTGACAHLPLTKRSVSLCVYTLRYYMNTQGWDAGALCVFFLFSLVCTSCWLCICVGGFMHRMCTVQEY